MTTAINELQEPMKALIPSDFTDRLDRGDVERSELDELMNLADETVGMAMPPRIREAFTLFLDVLLRAPEEEANKLMFMVKALDHEFVESEDFVSATVLPLPGQPMTRRQVELTLRVAFEEIEALRGLVYAQAPTDEDLSWLVEHDEPVKLVG